MVKSHQILHTFLSETTDFNKSQAQETISALEFKEGTIISPSTVLAVKKAFRTLGEGQFFLEYRSLARFLTMCQAGLKDATKKAGYLGDEQLAKLVKNALERQRLANDQYHKW